MKLLKFIEFLYSLLNLLGPLSFSHQLLFSERAHEGKDLVLKKKL